MTDVPTLHVFEAGCGHDVVLLHGLPSPPEDLEALAADLPGLRIFVPHPDKARAWTRAGVARCRASARVFVLVAESLDVGEIFGPADSAFVRDEISLGDEKDVYSVQDSRDATAPRLIDCNTLDVGHDVDLVGRPPQRDGQRTSEVIGRDRERPKTKLAKSRHERQGIVQLGHDHDVDVDREARVPVEADRVAANDEVPNAMRVQALQKFAEVVGERHCAVDSSDVAAPP